MVETLDGARYPDGEIAVKTALADRVASGIEKHIGGRSARRHLAKIDDAVAPVGGVDQHKAATADIAAARVDDGQRIADRDRRIDRIAAGLKDAPAGLAGLVLRRHHHAALPLRRRRRAGNRRRNRCEDQQNCERAEFDDRLITDASIKPSSRRKPGSTLRPLVPLISGSRLSPGRRFGSDRSALVQRRWPFATAEGLFPKPARVRAPWRLGTPA